MAKTYAMGLISAMAAASASSTVYADGPFTFSPFSSNSPASPPDKSPPPPSSSPSPTAKNEVADSSAPRVRNDNPRTSSAGFDPEALERGVIALKEIASSSQAKKV